MSSRLLADNSFVELGRAGRDGRLGLLTVRSDHNPGDPYLFDFGAKKAQFLFARNQRVDPKRMAAMEPVRFQDCDGMPLHGYLTLPPGRIKVPVLLAAGAEDEIAPAIHAERMLDARLAAGAQVEAKIYQGEGHGFFVQDNRIDHYRRLLVFLDRHIGGGSERAAASTSTASGTVDSTPF